MGCKLMGAGRQTMFAAFAVSALQLQSIEALAVVRTYTIQGSESRVTVSGNIAGIPLTEQGPGGLATYYTGGITADHVGNSLQFLGSEIDAVAQHSWQPGVGGVPGSAPADYGGKFSTLAVVAARNLVVNLASGPLTISSQSVDLSQVTISFLGTSALDYSYDAGILGSGSGSQSLVGGSYTSNLTGTGSVLTGEAHETLVIPINAVLPFEDLNGNPLLDGELQMSGTIVARTHLAFYPGDFDFDGDVDGADFVVWQTSYPGPFIPEGYYAADADFDGDVDGADFVVWQTNFPFAPASAGAAPVPEPSSVILLFGAGAALFRRKLVRR